MRVWTRGLLVGSLSFLLIFQKTKAQNAPVFTSVTGKLVRVTPPLRDIDKNSVYGRPFRITRRGDGLAGIREPEVAEERIFRNQFPDNPNNRFQPQSQDNNFLASIATSINLNMDGQTATGFAPSDNNMAVGPNHIIQIINHSSGSLFKVWNKSGGVVQASTVLSSLTGLTGGSGDPVVLYDQLADRWFLSEFGETGNVNYINTLIIAISTTGDPTGSWKVYSWVVQNNGTNYFADYPKYGIWHNAYYGTTNDFNTAGTVYQGSSIYAFDRTAMLAGAATATMVRTRFSGSGNRYYSMAPVCMEGQTTSNQSGLFAFIQDNTWVGAPKDSIFIFEYTPNFITPASSVVGPFRAMATQAFTTNTGSLPQQGTAQTLQALNQRLMNKVIYRNFGNSESIVCNTTDLANGRTGVHWWELRRPGSGNWDIYQEGLYQPASDNHYRFMGSICINGYGDIGLLYNLTSSTIYPSARFTARNSCDPLGSMTLAETVVRDGTTYEASNNRYGDYNSLSTDPSNGSFWGTAQYNTTGNGTYGNWATRLVNFSITPCGPNAGTVSGTSPLCVGQTAIYTSNGDAGGTWSSSNTSIATVNASTGLVTAVAAGSTNIIYTVSGVNASKSLTVNASVSAGTVSGGSPLCIAATATYSSNGTAGGAWSSSNTSIATVNASSGLVTAVAAGTTNIIYSVSGCSSPVTSFKLLTVSPNVSAGTVTGTSPICVGTTTTYNSNGAAGGAWSSSNTSIATVNASTGLVSAVAAGTTNIVYTVSSGCGGPVSSSKNLTVTASVTAGTVSGTSPICIGTTTAYSSNGTSGGTWSSSNTTIATVSVSGLVTALAAGTTNIIYTVSGCGSPVSSSKTLTVNANVSAGIVSGTSPVCIGTTTTYTSSGTSGGTWSSSNTTIATVNAGSGLVTAVSAGTTNIIYTVSSGCGSPVSSSKNLVVSATVNAGTISGSSPICVGTTTAYSSNGTTGGAWSSSNTSIATVNASSGTVTAVAAGTTDITYTVNSGCGSPVSSSKNLVVNPAVTAGTVTGISPVCIGTTTAYSSSGTAGGTWSSSNTSVATVSAAGVVTAIADGTADITYTVTSSCGGIPSSSKTITVNPTVSAGAVYGSSPFCIGQTSPYSTDGDDGGTWSSSNTSVATVTAAGVVTAVSAGTTNIIYLVSSGCGSPVSSSRLLTVNPNVSAGIVSGSSPLCVGVTASFNSDGTTGGAWSSSNTSVATVDVSTGVVTTVAAGTTDISYTVNSGCGSPVSSSKNLVVNNCVAANDNAPGAILITIGAGCSGNSYTNEGATQTAGEPFAACKGTAGYKTVWFRFVAPASGAVKISTDYSGGTMGSDTRIALFSATNVNDYATFTNIACDDDNGVVVPERSILYAVGLVPGTTYYVQVDGKDANTTAGTFCFSIDEMNVEMISGITTCTAGQSLTNMNDDYTGWLSAIDANGALIAFTRSLAGTPTTSTYNFSQNINAGAVRNDGAGRYYLDRNFKISNSSVSNATVRFVFLNTELTALQAVDPAVTIANLQVTRQTGDVCENNFVAASGTNTSIAQSANGSASGFSWIDVNTPGFSKFYLHTRKAFVANKIFIQGAYSSALGRLKDVLGGTPPATPNGWYAATLNSLALNQPYNVPPFNYAGTESVSPGFFTATVATTDPFDWVLIELRDAITPTTVVARRAGFIREDGRVVDLDGVSDISFTNVANGNYFVTILHRNHLGVRSAATRAVDGTLGATAPFYDFTTAQSQAYQDPAILSLAAPNNNPAMKDLGGGVFGMWGGNSNSNNTVRASGPLSVNDYLSLITTTLGGNVNNIQPNVYKAADINMDGSVRASGPLTQNDYLFLITIVLGGDVNKIITQHQ